MRWIGLVAVVWLAMGGVAEAQTVISPESDARFPYQRWVNQAKVPTPDVSLRIVMGIDRDYCEPEADGCTLPNESVIWLRPELPGWLTRLMFLHELGHNYFAATGAEDSERLADSYALCALGRRVVLRVGFAWPRGTGRICRDLRNSPRGR